ncbi:MAG: hypothetical protein JNK63_05955 [Chthonomonas sp.]|nr:hypothetical protein [Chthonomonas sp.]
MESRSLSWGKALFASLLLVISTVPAIGQQEPDLKSFVALIGDKAYILGEARAVSSGGMVAEFMWSDSGQTVLFNRLDLKITSEIARLTNPEAPPSNTMASVMTWNRRTNAVSQIYRYDLQKEIIFDYGIMPDDRTTYLLSMSADYKSQTLTINVPGMRPEVIKAAENEFLGVSRSPKSSTLFLMGGTEGDGTTLRLNLFDSVSKRWTPIGLDLKKEQTAYPFSSEDGNTYLVIVTRGSKERSYLRFDLRRGLLVTATREELNAALEREEESSLPIQLYRQEATLPDGRKTNTIMLDAPLSSPEPAKKNRPLHFAVGANSHELAPEGDGVLYTLDGLLIYREIATARRELFDHEDGPMTKEKAMSNAKQVGLSLIMYASDNDDFMPVSDFKEAVMPYSKNEDIFSGFIYTYQGGNLADIKDPSNTPLGFIKGPGGTATVYADGSVRWKEDLEPELIPDGVNAFHDVIAHLD